MKLLVGEVVSLNNWSIENSHLIEDYSYPPEEEEKNIEQIEPPILNKVNLLDKAINLFKLKPGRTNPNLE
jgi:protein-tyrosine phosphatase